MYLHPPVFLVFLTVFRTHDALAEGSVGTGGSAEGGDSVHKAGGEAKGGLAVGDSALGGSATGGDSIFGSGGDAKGGIALGSKLAVGGSATGGDSTHGKGGDAVGGAGIAGNLPSGFGGDSFGLGSILEQFDTFSSFPNFEPSPSKTAPEAETNKFFRVSEYCHGENVEYDERCHGKAQGFGCGASGKPGCRFSGCGSYPAKPGILGEPEPNPIECSHKMDYLEGDILIIGSTADQFLDKMRHQNSQINDLLAKGGSKESEEYRSIVRERTLVWPKGLVPYSISSKFAEDERKEILLSMATIQRFTCVRFVARTDQTDYLDILRGDGCYSLVGRWSAAGGQPLLLGYGCLWRGVVLHELLHALGLYHEQSRIDRQEHIKVLPENIRKDSVDQFMVYTLPDVDHKGLPYDLDSLMHYHQVAFSRDGLANTVVPKKLKDANLLHAAQRYLPSENDILKINRLYECKPKELDVPEDGGTMTAPSPSTGGSIGTGGSAKGGDSELESGGDAKGGLGVGEIGIGGSAVGGSSGAGKGGDAVGGTGIGLNGGKAPDLSYLLDFKNLPILPDQI